jgi:hypothetical protein
VREGVVVSQNDLGRCDLVIDNALLRASTVTRAAGNAPPACIDSAFEHDDATVTLLAGHGRDDLVADADVAVKGYD